MIKKLDLSNKVVLISGGYGHLGTAITKSCLYYGAKVYVLGRNQLKFKNRFPNFKKERNLFFELCDITNSLKIEEVFHKIEEKEGQIDVLINNAFSTIGKTPECITDLEWEVSLNGILASVHKCIRAIIPFFKKQNHGKIINVSSMYGFIAPDFAIYNKFEKFTNLPNYGAAKAGVIQLTKYYASYLGRHSINVNSISPGPFPSLEVQKEKEFIENLKRKTALNKIGKPEDLAGVFVFLASEAANFITGQNIIVDGGWTIK